MERLRVIAVEAELIRFDDGTVLTSDHEQSCCESHYLSMADLTLGDFDGLFFDLSDHKFFERIEDYGIHLIPVNGHAIPIPGYGYNNGYYSSNLNLVISSPNKSDRYFDIDDCQVISG